MKGPHCPDCGCTEWNVVEKVSGDRTVDPPIFKDCASCGWKDGDQIPPLSDFVHIEPPKGTLVFTASRLERLVCALLVSRVDSYSPSYDEFVSNVVMVAKLLDQKLMEAEKNG